MSSLMRFDLAPDSLQFIAGGDYPAKRSDNISQVQDRTAAGSLRVETLGVQIRTRVLDFNLMSKTDYLALRDWFLNTVNGGSLIFTFTDEYGDSGLVRIVTSDLDFSETSLERYSGSIKLEYV